MKESAPHDARPEFDPEAEMAIGAKVLEMCDRVRVAHICCPGAVAAWAVEVDGTRYDVRVTVAQGGA